MRFRRNVETAGVARMEVKRLTRPHCYFCGHRNKVVKVRDVPQPKLNGGAARQFSCVRCVNAMRKMGGVDKSV